MVNKLILISGRKGVGKTYVTEYLEGMLAGKVEIYPMATMLKRIVAVVTNCYVCLLYTSDAADDLLCVGLGGRRILKKKKNKDNVH